MKELRIKRQQIRVFFAFDPRRVAILLVGGAKKGADRFYGRLVRRAEALMDMHLKRIESEPRG